MKHTRKDLSPTSIQLSIALDAADLARIKKLTLTKLSKNIKVAGFRTGKVPASVAEKNIDSTTLASHLVEDAVNAYVIEAVTQEDVRALDSPKVEVEEYKPDTELKFTATVEVLPKITLGDYKKLKATRKKAVVSADDINDVIERLRLGFAEKKEVARAAKQDDEVWIDFVGVDKDGKEVAGASGKDYPLKLGSNTFIPGFEEGLTGKKTGDEFDLPLSFPKDYHAAHLAGAKVTFKVTVKKVNEVSLPKVDDEFAAKTGPFTSVADMKADIKSELVAQKEREAADALKDSLIEQLVGASDVPVPEVLVADQMNSIERDTVQNLLYRGMTLEQYVDEQNLTKDEWREKELRPAATRRVQVGLVLAELSKAESIEVTKEELDARHQEMLGQYNDSSVQQQLDTPDARRDLANRVMTEKTVDRLVELNAKS